MIKNVKVLRQFENELKRKEKPDFYKNLKIVEALHKEAIELKVFNQNPLDGLDTVIKVARIVNHVGENSRAIKKLINELKK